MLLLVLGMLLLMLMVMGDAMLGLIHIRPRHRDRLGI